MEQSQWNFLWNTTIIIMSNTTIIILHPSKSKTKINKSKSNAFQKHEHISNFPNVLFAKTDKNQF